MNWITQKEANELIYEGNSISYIYTKMKCYSDQVGMAYDALRKLGFDTSLPNGNKEMKNALILFVEQQNQLKQRNKDLERAYTVLALKISQYLNGNLSVSAEDIKKEWKRGEQLLKGKSDG